MTALLVALALATGITPDEVPVGETAVVDVAGVLAPADRDALEAQVRALHETRKVQLAIVVVGSVSSYQIEAWGIRVFERWGLGAAGADDGVLLILAMDDRLSRLEVGYGLESYIPDEHAQRILDAMRDDLRAGDVAGALDGAVDDIASAVSEYEQGALAPPILGRNGFAPIVVMLFGLLAGLGFVVARKQLQTTAERLRKKKKEVAGNGRRAHQLLKLRKWLLAILWLPLPLLVAWVFRRGEGFWWAMALTYLIWSVLGMSLVVTARRSIIALTIYTIVLVSAVVWIAMPLAQVAFAVGGDALQVGLVCGGALLFAWGFCALVSIMPAGGTSGGSGSGSYSSGGYSSSSSSSSSSASYSSSSSSSSYSGGGGSSGGGGATSSW